MYKSFYFSKKKYPQLIETSGVELDRAQRSSVLTCRSAMTEIGIVTLVTFETFKLYFGVINLEKIVIHDINVWILDSNPMYCKPH